MAFRVEDAGAAYKRALALGAKPVADQVGPMELNIPAIEGIGGSAASIWSTATATKVRSMTSISNASAAPIRNPSGAGLCYIDHLTHNVYRGRMNDWAGFYERLFNFREIRYFDIEGKMTGLKSRAMTSPDGKIRIPINESADDKSQIEEYLHGLSRRGHPAYRARPPRSSTHGRDAAPAAA